MSQESRDITKSIEANDLTTARTLCESHSQQLVASGELQYLLDFAAGANRPAAMELLASFGADLNAPLDQYTHQGVLYTATASGASDSVRWLLQNGAAVNVPEKGQTLCLPLFVAIRSGHKEIVELLVGNGAMTNAVWNGETPIGCAQRAGHYQIVRYLQSVVGE